MRNFKIATMLFFVLASCMAWPAEPGLHLDLDASELDITGTPMDDKQTGYSAGLGYSFNKHFSVEADFVSMGREPIGSDGNWGNSALIEGWSYGLEFSQEIWAGFHAYGRLGLYDWEADVSSVPNAYKSELSGTDLFHAFGISYEFVPEFSVHAELADYATGSIESSVISVGFRVTIPWLRF